MIESGKRRSTRERLASSLVVVGLATPALYGCDIEPAPRTDVLKMMEDAGIERDWDPSKESLLENTTREILQFANDGDNPEAWFDAVAIRDSMQQDPQISEMIRHDDWDELEGLTGRTSEGNSYHQLSLDLVNIGSDRVNQALEEGDIETANEYIKGMERISQQNPNIRDYDDKNKDRQPSIQVAEAKANVIEELFSQGKQAIEDGDLELAVQLYAELKRMDTHHPESRIAKDRLDNGHEEVAHVQLGRLLREAGNDIKR